MLSRMAPEPLTGVRTENPIRVDDAMESARLAGYRADLFLSGRPGLAIKSKLRLEVKNAVPRHQLLVLIRKLPVASGSRTKIAGS